MIDVFLKDEARKIGTHNEEHVLRLSTHVYLQYSFQHGTVSTDKNSTLNNSLHIIFLMCGRVEYVRILLNHTVRTFITTTVNKLSRTAAPH